MSPVLKCLFKYIFCIVTNISVKKTTSSQMIGLVRLIHHEMWAYQSSECPLLLTDSQLQLVRYCYGIPWYVPRYVAEYRGIPRYSFCRRYPTLLISLMVTLKLIWVFIFANAKRWISHDVAQILSQFLTYSKLLLGFKFVLSLTNKLISPVRQLW